MRQGTIISTFFDEYTIIKQVGQGGNCKVFSATNKKGDTVAVKFLGDTESTEKSKRFKNEMDFCYNSRHENIVRVIDFGTYTDDTAQSHFFVMPLYKSSLRTVMKNQEFEGNEFKYILAILNGMKYAHELGIVHRDIKPENILVNNHNDVVIADFGIARFSRDLQKTEVETKKNSRMANFHYSSPEQKVSGAEVDHRADIYALGLVMNELFTSAVPLGTDYKQITSVNPEYEYLDSVIERMIKQSVSDRYNSIDDVLKDIVLREKLQAQSKRIKELEGSNIVYSSAYEPMDTVPSIKSVDWNDKVLTIEITHHVPKKWVDSFCHMGSHTSVMGHGPETFTFRGNIVTHTCDSRIAQNVINYFKQWLPLATQEYNNRLEAEKNRAEREEIQRIQQEIQKEEERRKLLESLKF